MRALDLKLVRDLWRMRGQALAIALVIAAATATFVLSLGVYRSLAETRDLYYERNHFAEIFAGMTRAPRSIVDRVEALDGVARAEGRIVQYATLELPGRIEPIRGVVNSVGEGGASELNRLIVVEGRGPGLDRADEVVVDKAFADANGLHPGDTIRAQIYGNSELLTIVGIGLAPDYIWAIPPGDLMPDNSRFSIMWMGEKALEAATDQVEAINSLSLTLERGASEADVIRRVDGLLAPYGGTGAYGREDHLSHAFLDSELTQLEAMTQVIPPIFLLVSVFLVYIVLGRMIRTEREEIGLLKAFGYSSLAVGWHYLKFALAIALLGTVIGSAAGIWMGRSMTELYVEYYRFPFLRYRLSPTVLLFGAALAFGSAAIGAIGGVRSAAGLSPAVAMAPPPPPVYRAGLIERLGTWAGFTSIGHMIARHVARWPARSAMTVTGVGLSLGLLFSTMQFIDSTNALLDSFFFRAQRQDMTVTFTEPRNEQVLHDLARLPGVFRVEAIRAVPVRMSHGALSERTAIEASESDSLLTARIDAAEREVALPSAGLMLSSQLAAQLEVGPGDSVHVALLGGRRTESDMRVATVIEEYVGARAYASDATLERLTRDASPVGSALLRIDPAAREAILAELREMPVVLGVTERTAGLARFRQMIDDNILRMIGFYVAFASAIAVGVIYNSARILFSERVNELATLRVLGYYPREVAVILLGEVALLIALAVPVGCFLGYWMAQLIVLMFSSDLFRIPFAPSRASYGLSTVVVLVAAALTALAVARRVLRLDMVRVLKARD